MLIILQEWFGVVSCVWETVCRCSQSVCTARTRWKRLWREWRAWGQIWAARRSYSRWNTSTVSPVTRITLDRYSTPLQSPSGRQTEIMSFSSALSAVHLHWWRGGGTLKRFWIWWRVTFTLTGVFSRLSIYWHHSRLALCDIDQK